MQNYFEGDDSYVSGDEWVGDDDQSGPSGDDAANVLGQVARALVRRPGGPARRPAGPGGRKIFKRPPLPATTAQPTEAELRSYMGMGFAVWAPADAVDRVLTVEPQESFRGERLILDVTAVGGTPAGQVLLRRIEVGTMPQSPSVEQAAPASMFRPDVTGGALDLQIAFRGTKLTVTLGVTAAPGAGVTVTASAGFYGQWLR